jgi:lipoprotein-anchoring transpeptidase ErfK/SrfK
MPITRRSLLLGLSAALAGCTTQHSQEVAYYGPRPNESHPLPGMPLSQIKPELRRATVDYPTREKPGTVIVDTPARRLYYVLGDNKAIRYAVSVGREGLELRGAAYVGRKAEWPTWTPTSNMIERQPEIYRKLAGGMEGGVNNPLGARALYLYRGGNDTHFRIHGTNQPQSIGYAMSSGCIRMLNYDVIDLYDRVPTGSKVIVIQEPVSS